MTADEIRALVGELRRYHRRDSTAWRAADALEALLPVVEGLAQCEGWDEMGIYSPWVDRAREVLGRE